MTTKYQPGTRVSEYVLEECVGTGAFGEVWRARHHVWTDDHVAVKLPTEPEYVRYLQREGVVVHGLRHPNIIRVIGLDPYGDTPYLVMEFVNGPSLRQVIDEHPLGLELDVALAIFRGLLHGIGAAHAGNVIHRDLKPGNVLLDLDGKPLEQITVENVRIGDFGLGVADGDTLRSLVIQSASIERDDQSAVLAGTLAYMAPEVRDGRSAPTPKSDLYAIGVILYEMLTGERPAGAELPSTLRAHVPAALDEIFRRLYAHHERRYESAAQVLADVEQIAVKRAVTPPPVPEWSSLPGPERSSPPARCPECRGAVEPDDQFCTQCGRQLVADVTRCAACGGYPGPHDRFCIFCGAALAPRPE